MHYPLTDIQAHFEINRPIRYQITRKEITSTDGRTDVAYDNRYFFFEKRKTTKETQNRSNAHTIVELCAIRDGTANCDIMACTKASKLIDLITFE